MIVAAEMASVAASPPGRIVSVVRDHPERDRLAPFCLDVLTRQAEGRAVVCGRPYVVARSEQYGVERQTAATEFGNVLDLLERGAQTDDEYAVLSAFAVAGLEGVNGVNWSALMHQFDWLERETGYSPYGFIDALLAPADAEPLWRAIGRACCVPAESPVEEASRAFHLALLQRSDHPTAQAILGELAAPRADALARVYAPSEADEAETHEAKAIEATAIESGPIVLEGRGGELRGITGFHAAMQVAAWVTGVAALRRLASALAWLATARMTCRLQADNRGLSVARRTRLLGRTIRHWEAFFPWGEVTGIAVERRFPFFLTAVGLMSFACGVAVGGSLLVDGVWSGETVLLLLGAAILLAGTGVDLIVDSLVPRARGQAVVTIDLASKRQLVMRGLAPPEARKVVAELTHLRSRSV